MAQVLPSGDDFATDAVPMLPPPPARFSIMTVVPSRCCMYGWIKRAIMSVDPPGGYGTTILICLRASSAHEPPVGRSAHQEAGSAWKACASISSPKNCAYAAMTDPNWDLLRADAGNLARLGLTVCDRVHDQ